MAPREMRANMQTGFRAKMLVDSAPPHDNDALGQVTSVFRLGNENDDQNAANSLRLCIIAHAGPLFSTPVRTLGAEPGLIAAPFLQKEEMNKGRPLRAPQQGIFGAFAISCALPLTIMRRP